MKIKPYRPGSAEISVPGSKSYSHRILLASSLAGGVCRIRNCLASEDTRLTVSGLKQMGVSIQENKQEIVVQGRGGTFSACAQPIFLGNSGTSMRLLTAAAALGRGTYTFYGTERMHERPMTDLLDGLNQAGVVAKSANDNGCPPVKVEGGSGRGGNIRLRCGKSSQFLSAILLISPFFPQGMDIEVVEGPVSRPYIDMTLDVMQRFGVHIFREGYRRFRLETSTAYHPGLYTVEPDASQAGYFWAAAAVTGGDVKVKGIYRNSKQGDIRLLLLLEAMGCRVIHDVDGIRVLGGPLSAINADMADIPDMVPTLAVVAAFAKGTSSITNAAHLKEKESDRLSAVATELRRMGIRAFCTADGLTIEGGRPHGASIDTYNDHRIAMSFAMAGLVTSGVDIRNPDCVEKSFPNFWEVFGALQKSSR